MIVVFAVAIAIVHTVAATPLQYSGDVQCAKVDFPPKDPSRQVPWAYVNLDLPPIERWGNVAELKKQEIRELVKVIIDLVENATGSAFLKELIDITMAALWETLPEPYKYEMLGISRIVDIPIGEITLYNVFYEIFSVCTSIVAQAPDGNLYHARNLDFGLILGWDVANNTWLLPPYLRRASVNVKFVDKTGKVVFEGAQFAGYVGLFSGLKPHAFSLTMNERFKLKGGFMGIFEWIKGNHSLWWAGLLMRDVLLKQTTYAGAKQQLIEAPIMAPAYYILGGVNPGEGCVVTRGIDEKPDVWEMTGITKHPWFILQTNYDHWLPAPFFDDRQTPGNQCMMDQGAQAAGYASIFNVLNTVPNLNKLTVHAALMCARCGDDMQTYLQHCPATGYCSMW